MLNLQLYIEGQEVDLFKDESVTLTQSIQDIMNLDKVGIEFTRSFQVPASKKNNKIFKHFHNPMIIGFDAREKKPAELLLNYKPFKKGKIKLEGASTKNNKAHTYKVTFFGNTIILKDLLGDAKLSGLSYLQQFFFYNYNSTTLKAYMTDGLDITDGTETYTDALVFPLITHSKRLIYDTNFTSSNVNSTTQNNVAYNSSSANYGLEISQLKPALRIYAIIRAIEETYGITFSRDFFNTTNENFYNLYLWLSSKTGEKAVQTGSNPLNAGNFIYARNFIITYRLRGAVTNVGTNDFYWTGTQNLDRFFAVTVTPPSVDNFNVLLYKDGKLFREWKDVTGNVESNAKWSSEQEGGLINLGVAAGRFTIAIEGGTGTYDLEIDVRVNKSGLSKRRRMLFTGQAFVNTFERINIVSQMPDIKVIDFISGLFKMFNLTAFVDENNVVNINSLDSFYQSSTNLWDITQYVDKTKQSVETAIPFKEIDFAYKGLENFFAASHEELFNTEWGSVEQKTTSETGGETFSLELPFEHFKFERLRNLTGGSTTNIQWGWSADIKQDAFLGEPLLFYPVLQTLDMGVKDLEGNVTQFTSAYIPSNSVATTDSFAIHFNGETNEFAEVPFEKTLFSEYYQKYITEIFDKQRRLRKTNAFLPLSIITNLSLADKIRIFDVIYLINKIETNFETGESKLELINTRTALGELVEQETIIPDKFILQPDSLLPSKTPEAPICITIDQTERIDELYQITIDRACENDGFDVLSTREVIPNDLDTGTQPKVVKIDSPLPVTSATLASFTTAATSSFISTTYYIMTLGKVGEVAQLNEYGIFHSTTASDLSGTTYATLVAGNATQIKFETTELDRMPVVPKKVEAQVTGLSSSTTVYWKAYVRTNTDPTYGTSDVISNRQSGTTT